MLRDKFIYIFLFVSLVSFGQQKSKMYLASLQQASVGVVDFFPVGNAASAGAGEANSTSGWTPSSGTFVTISSVGNTDGGGGGSFAIQVNSTSAGFRNGKIAVSGLNLTPHTATIRYRITDGTGRIFNWDNVSGAVYTNLSDVSGTWQVGTATFTPTTGTINVAVFPGDNDGTVTGTIEVSEIVITEN